MTIFEHMLPLDAVTPFTNIIERAIAAFQRQARIPADIQYGHLADGQFRGDGLLTLRPPRHAETRFVIELKRADRFAALGAIKARFDAAGLPYPGLLITPYLAPKAVDECRQLGLCFLDTVGNAFVQGEGLFILIKGQPKPADDLAVLQAKATTPAALRVAFVLLCDETLLGAPYRTIAEAAHAALGTIGGVFADWHNRGMVTEGTHTTQPRLLLERRKLIDDWVAHFPTRLRPKLHPQRFTAPDRDWWTKVNPREYDAVWGGEIAADHYTNNLHPAAVTLYMNEVTRPTQIGRLVMQHHLRPDPRGEIEVLDKFWTLAHRQGGRPDLDTFAPPLLVYADLVATNDPRNLQVAQALNAPWLLHDAPGALSPD